MTSRKPGSQNFRPLQKSSWIIVVAGVSVVLSGLFWVRFPRNSQGETALNPEIPVGQFPIPRETAPESLLRQKDKSEMVSQKEQALKMKVLSLKEQAAAARQVADSGAPFYLEGLDYEQLGSEALEEKSYLQAEDLYTKAVRAFGMSQPRHNGSDVVDRVKDERAELEQAIAGLVQLYQSLLKNKELDGLANFLKFSKSEREEWKTFFETVQTIEAGVEVEEISLLKARGEARLKVSLSHLQEGQNTSKIKDFDLHWNLEKVVQGWRIVP